MPSFCRHNRLVQNCPICSREQNVEPRAILSTSRTEPPRRPQDARRRSEVQRSTASGQRAGVKVSRLERSAGDGFHSRLVPGLKSSTDAERLALELAFSVTRLGRLETAPPGLYAEVADPGDLEERTWLAFLIAYLCPLDRVDPFEGVRFARSSWASGAVGRLDGVPAGPRAAHDPRRGASTIDAYRAWVHRAGSQAQAFTGESAWTPERRFARVYERLALPGLHRDARFDLLVTLGRLGVYEMRAGALHFGGGNETTLAAKRVLGIGDPLLLERRAAELASACGVELEALDVGLYNWGRGERATLGLGVATESDPDALGSIRTALGLG